MNFIGITCLCAPIFMHFIAGAAAGAAFLGTQLLTVGEDGSIAVWSLHHDSSGSIDGRSGQQQRQRVQHPDLNVTMRSWLQQPAAAPSNTTMSAGLQSPAARMACPAGSGGVVLPELQAVQRDTGEVQQGNVSCSTALLFCCLRTLLLLAVPFVLL
jgi:hypothetical protein